MKFLNELKNQYYKTVLFLIKLYIKIKWSPWNPWSVGKMNLAWTKYVTTELYTPRQGVDREFRSNTPNYGGDIAYEMFVEHNEFDYFYAQRTLSDRARLLFAPFSFGNRFRMPFWQIRWWWYGIDSSGL